MAKEKIKEEHLELDRTLSYQFYLYEKEMEIITPETNLFKVFSTIKNQISFSKVNQNVQ